MKKRILALFIAVIFFIPVSMPAEAAAPDYLNSTVVSHAEGVAKAAASYESSYKFGNDGISKEEMSLIMTLVYNDNPELFCLSSSYSYSYKTDAITGEEIILSVFLKYSMEKEEYKAAMGEVNKWKSEVASLADPSFTELEYALFFHDYLVANYEYDTDLKSRNLYSFIKNGRGVCQAYAYAYAVLLEHVGIDVSWASSAEMNHLWNLVKIDGEWYHADVTWDDPVGANPGIVRHSYFLLSDKAISTDVKGHFGWVSPYACTSEKYDNSAFGGIGSAFAYLEDKWYYMAGGDLYSTGSVEIAGSKVMELDLVWKVWNSSNVYTSCYSAVVTYNGFLYISTPDSILKVDPAAGMSTEVYKYTGGEGYIYGFRMDLGEDGVSGAGFKSAEVKVHISKAPDKVGSLVDVALVIVAADGKGDVNGDGKINLGDASLMLKYIAKWNVTIDTDAADYDSSGKVNLADVNHVLKKIAGWY